MPYYPILVDLAGKKVVVVGGGHVAQRKIESLLQHGARVYVAAKDLTPALSQYVDTGEITYLGHEFQEEYLRGAFLVIAATDDASLNHRVSTCAKERGVLVNAVDQPTDCTFIVPSVLRRGDLRVAVSTSGKSPALARKIREDLESHFGQEYETLLELMGNLRKDILSKGLSQKENKEIFENLINSRILEMIKQKDWEGIASLVTNILQRSISTEEILEILKAE